MSEIDLTSLQGCFKFYSLILFKNKLQEIALEPIGRIETLRGLNLAYNRIQRIDLRPLFQYSQMKEIHLYGNPLEKLDKPDVANPGLMLESPEGRSTQ
ncbi:MAG: hypothetical protein ACTSPR_04225 [Candidatus Thorarchaeota archaeon]